MTCFSTRLLYFIVKEQPLFSQELPPEIQLNTTVELLLEAFVADLVHFSNIQLKSKRLIILFQYVAKLTFFPICTSRTLNFPEFSRIVKLEVTFKCNKEKQ